MAKNSVSLRNEREENYVRIITASYNADGDLIIAGHDLGDRVQTFFACSEYEYAWAIRAVHLPKLKRALGNPDNLLEALKARFSDENADDLEPFLKDNKIVKEFWSRIGD